MICYALLRYASYAAADITLYIAPLRYDYITLYATLHDGCYDDTLQAVTPAILS